MNPEEHQAAMDRIQAEREAKSDGPMTRAQGTAVIVILSLLLVLIALPALKYLLS